MTNNMQPTAYAVQIDDIQLNVNEVDNLYPSAPAPTIVINESRAREYLTSKQWPNGLQDTLINSLYKIPIRFFVGDDSGSMMTYDGHKLVHDKHSNKSKMISCSRWSELTETLKFHAGLAHAASAPSEFRLLNGSEPLLIGTNEDDLRYSVLMNLLDGSPNGGTPICRHIAEVTETIRSMETLLRANSQYACLIIATDGESSDGDLAEAMRPLKDLPVWVVVRLCTDEEKIVNYWNTIDNLLELPMDVLDDFRGEALEAYSANSWLTYGEPMHRLREFGTVVKEIDILDESLLSIEEVRKMCLTIFGGKLDDFPNPETNWNGFVKVVDEANKNVPLVWCSRHNAMKPWINISNLQYLYGNHWCTIV